MAVSPRFATPWGGHPRLGTVPDPRNRDSSGRVDPHTPWSRRGLSSHPVSTAGWLLGAIPDDDAATDPVQTNCG
jgi:hypothetical protein